MIFVRLAGSIAFGVAGSLLVLRAGKLAAKMVARIFDFLEGFFGG